MSVEADKDPNDGDTKDRGTAQDYKRDTDSESDDDQSFVSVEVEDSKANSLPFANLCKAMELLWKMKQRKKNKPSEEQKMKYLLPLKLLRQLEGQSVFPLFRLLVPDIDTSRNIAMKEKAIANMYCDVEGFAKGTANYEKLHRFVDSSKAGHKAAGEFSLAVQEVLSKRIPDKPSSLTLRQINLLLDDLAKISQRSRNSYNHEWRNNSSGNKRQKTETKASLSETWLRRVMSKGLSPLEHKWLVRIILQKPEYGSGWRSILKWYSPYSLSLWNAHNSLKNLCDKLADPEYKKARDEERARKAVLQSGAATHRWEPQEQPVALGNTISPMLSSRVSFSNCMSTLEWNHKEYCKGTTTVDCLAMKFPAICAEIKLDGERIVAHVKDGQVTMQTRNGKWYSQLYSPVLGPSIRRALSKYQVDVILDGEVESWDNGREELVPFGNNRTVANARRHYMQRQGMLEDVDRNLHATSDGSVTDPSVMRISDDFGFVKKQLQNDDSDRDIGKECWLQFIIFDILYVDGPDAKQLFRDCLMDDDAMKSGSIIHLTLLQRKLLLHQLIEEQPNSVEIGKAVVVRPNGDCVRADKYFSISNPLMDGPYSGAILDSTHTAIQGCLPSNIQEIDHERRKGRNNIEINLARTKAVEAFYSTVVEQHKMEGLVLKDLASPYILGQASRSRKFWHKFKPDYVKGEEIDVVILGASFATGLRHSGKLSSFLCGVVDENDPSSFMPMLSVNGKSVQYETLDKIMEVTGYVAATADSPVQIGKWFEPDVPGKSVPDFISHRSYQRGMQEDFEGWKPSKKSYPDLWIDPSDSIVLELKGQEFVRTTEFTTGLTMRFPRIKYVRHEEIDGGAKSASDADSHRSLFQLYYETMRQRQDFSSASNYSSFSPSTSGDQIYSRRFLTPEEYSKKPKKRKAKNIGQAGVPQVDALQSQALRKIVCVVLEGNYRLDPDSLEAQDARDNGWIEEGLQVKRRDDVMRFILLHGGTIHVSTDSQATLIIGGNKQDARVKTCVSAIEYAKSQAQRNLNTKKSLQHREMAKRKGVLKWTFIYSIVHRFLAEAKRSANATGASLCEKSIEDTSNWMLVPKAHEYLARATGQDITEEDIFDLQRPNDVTRIELFRALEATSEEDNAIDATFSWQYQGHELTGLSLFRFENGEATDEPRTRIVLYPDIFAESFGYQNENDVLSEGTSSEKSRQRWKGKMKQNCGSIESVIPLASAMGALVTPHLHAGVTYVVAELEGAHSLSSGQATPSSFKCQKSGSLLIKRIRDLEADVHVVSPEWIRSQWRQSQKQ